MMILFYHRIFKVRNNFTFWFGIEYKIIPIFLWNRIKPYKFHYLMQIVAPVYTGFISLIFFYYVKHFIDIITKSYFDYNELIYPLIVYQA